MGATTSMLYSGAVEAAAGTAVTGAVSSVTSTYEKQEGLELTLYSLQQEIMKIQCAINAARRRRITDPQLLEWLASLIDAFYLGNYYHRTFKIRHSHPPMIAREGTSNLAISPTYRVAKRQRTIKTLLFGDEELSKLNDTLKKLKSIDISAFILMVNAYPEWPIKIYLYMDHNRLLNRDKEREQVMKFLLQPSKAGESNVDVLPIIGFEGAGKTSLVFHCFNDPKVQNHFSLKIYDQYSSFSYPSAIDARISEQILVQYNIADITNNDENTLLAMLKQKLSSERFLLVMDQVWLEDSMAWRALCDCLRCGKKGSKVIFIASSNVYNYYKKIMNAGAVKPIVLDGFSEDDYLSFFKEHAFGSADPEDYPELEKIGRGIATKMNGSIWAAKIFGELLRDNLNASFWSNFLQEGLLNSELSWQSKDLFEVIRNIPWVLPKRLPAVTSVGLRWSSGDKPLSHEVKSFRELMVLGPNRCTPVDRLGSICLEFLLAKHVFLNKCTVIKAVLHFD